MTIAALEAADVRSFEVDVAGSAPLLVANAHKIHDRLGSRRPERLEDKDATDLYRLVQTTSPDEVGARVGELSHDPLAGTLTDAAIAYLAEPFAPSVAATVRTTASEWPRGLPPRRSRASGHRTRDRLHSERDESSTRAFRLRSEPLEWIAAARENRRHGRDGLSSVSTLSARTRRARR